MQSSTPTSMATWSGLQGFKIIFEFTKNPYFSNQELVKTYYMVSDDEEDPVLQRATGTAIQWESGKNPGVKVSWVTWALASRRICKPTVRV